MLVAFQVRSLLERPKVNDQVRSICMPVLRYKKIGNRPFTFVGPGMLHDRFDLQSPERESMSSLDVCNQLIHYYWMQTCSDGCEFTSMLVFSDYKRCKCAYEFQIKDLLQLFQAFCGDSSAVVSAEFRWNEKKQDYVCTRALGEGGLQTASVSAANKITAPNEGGR